MKGSGCADASPVGIMDKVYAVYPSFAMLAGMQLDVFTPLSEGPMSADSLARSLGVRETKLSPLLYALVTAGLLTVSKGVFSNTDEADGFLVRGRPGYIDGLSGFYKSLWQAALNTAESIRTGKPQAKLDWMSLSEEELVRYFQGQYPGSLRAGKELAETIDFTRFKHLLDAGGGTGGVAIGICGACPDLESTVADLPTVIAVSKRFISEAGMSGRVRTVAADLREDPPAGSYDVAVLRALLQVMPPGDVGKVLCNVSKAMRPGARLFIVGSILDDSRLSPPASIAFSLVFLNVYDEGHAYTEKEHYNWLTEAGFTDISFRQGATSEGYGMISARKA